MAHMNQERKAQLAPEIKRVLNKYKLKGTISIRNHLTLVVTIKSGPIDFCQDWFDTWTAENSHNPHAHWINEVPNHLDVNVYHIPRQHSGRARKCLEELLAAMNQGNWNRSDVQTDYFDVGWYCDINVGSWNKPYVLER